VVALADGGVMLGAGLVGDGDGGTVDQIEVEGGGHPDRLRENGGNPRASHAVQALVPPVVGGDAQPLDGRSAMHHLRHFFVERHTGNQVRRALGGRAGHIQVKRLGGIRHRIDPP